MSEFYAALVTASQLIVSLDPDLAEIVLLSLRVSLLAVGLAALIGMPLGAAIALYCFPGRSLLATLLNACMGLPPVVVGLVVYLLLSRSGPLGPLGLLFTPTAMVIAQCVLVTPIIAALTRQTISDLNEEYDEQFRAMGAGGMRKMRALLWDGRFSLVTAVLAGFGRASSEVGAVLIVGGNIDHVTRVMTTTIALETSKGNLALALALGLILIAISVSVNAAAMSVRDVAYRRYR
ncbi:MAG: ABC transporter permease [Gammaproteobacteria bacterium]|nr:ABC transporter permease [Gammaproteobacteria bacterium]MBA3732078.1 ABC transporter permease [Gammaproteobacteria bacterium]